MATTTTDRQSELHQKRIANLGDYAKRGGPGRPKGSQDALRREVVEDILTAYKELGGVEWLIAQGKAQPKLFAALLDRLIPRNSHIVTEPGEDFESYIRRLEQARRASEAHENDEDESAT